MKAIEIVAPIEEMAPLAGQEKWDNCGFVIGDPNIEVSHVLVALDCTEDVMDEAIECGADMIIAHHPLIFGGVKKISPDNWLGRIIYKAIQNNVVVYAAHTNMDKAAGGVSAVMAEKLALQDTEPLTPDNFGMVGTLPYPMGKEEFVGKIKDAFGIEVVRSSKLPEEKISRVAVCGGSGRSFIGDAMEKGAQVYVTGDITYHEFYTENGFAVMDIGHYSSEYGIVGVFANILSKNFPNFAVSISKRNNNPIYYH